MQSTFQTLMIFLMLAVGVFANNSAKRIAVLGVEDMSGNHALLVKSFPQMLVTELVQQTGEELVERNRIDSALQKLGGQSTLSLEASRQIGEWVGADRLLIGSYSFLSGEDRLDLRLVEVQSGRIIAAASASGKDGYSILVQNAVKSISSSLAPKYRDPYGTVDISSAGDGRNQKMKDQGNLRIRHKIVLSLLTEKAVPMQQVRIYLDRKLIAQSPIIKSVNEEYVLLDAPVEVGFHILELEHGVVSRTGEWKRNLEVQPEPTSIEIIKGKNVDVSYRMKVSSLNFSFEAIELQ